MDNSTAAELEATLNAYKTQLVQVKIGLMADPSDAELNQLHTDLQEIIALTSEMVAVKKLEEQEASVQALTSATAAFAEEVSAAQAPAGWQVGDEVCALYSGDGVWYNAVIDAIDADGNYTVTYPEYGNTEIVTPESVRPREGAPAKSNKGKGVKRRAAGASLPSSKEIVTEKKRDAQGNVIYKSSVPAAGTMGPATIVTDAENNLILPKSLEITDDDTPEQRESKKKKIRHLKSANRRKIKEEEQKAKQKGWKAFVTGTKKGKKVKKSMTKSIFQSPEDGGRVGVVGSGKEMTAQAELRKNKTNNKFRIVS